LRLLAWNIQNGGGARAARIVEEISAYDPDAVAVTEFRSGPGAGLSAALKEVGLVFVETTGPAANQDGIAVFSRTPIARRRDGAVPSRSSVRWLDIELPEYGFGLAVFHVMAAGSGLRAPATQAKIRFWNAMLRAAEARLSEPFLFAGDWNTGAHGLDERGKTFVCDRHFARLSALGWIDLWRRHNPGANEYTWYAKRSGVRGNGFRVDHVFATPSLAARVRACRYSHAEREAGISDHSVVIVEVE
jgi:exodeoxyribonuclease III